VKLGGTGNVLIRRECFSGPEPFDPAYGKTGGEDTDFFERLYQAEFSSVWCAEASVTEFLPKARCSQLYLYRRAFRSHQQFVRVERKNSRYGMVVGAYWFANGLVQAIALALPALGLSISRGSTAVRIKRRFFGALGKVLSVSMFNYEFYADHRNLASVRNQP
jgi:succinoglycan biosynthesis protein ExoM